MVSLSFVRTPDSFPSRLLSSQFCLQPGWGHGFVIQCNTLCFPMLTVWDFCWPNSLQPIRVPPAWQYNLLVHQLLPPSSSTLSADLLRMCFVSSSPSSIKMLCSIVPRYQHLGFSGSGCPPTGLCATNHSPLSTLVKSVLDPSAFVEAVWVDPIFFIFRLCFHS